MQILILFISFRQDHKLRLEIRNLAFKISEGFFRVIWWF